MHEELYIFVPYIPVDFSMFMAKPNISRHNTRRAIRPPYRHAHALSPLRLLGVALHWYEYVTDFFLHLLSSTE